MHLIVEVLWKLIAFLIVSLFVITLPFTLLALVIWHPHLSPQQEDAMHMFKFMAIMFGGCAAALWWVILRIAIYVVTKERVWIGGWSTVLVFVATYYTEYLLFSHGVIR